MAEDPQVIQQLSDSLIDEVVGSVGLPKNRFNHWLAWRQFRRITDRRTPNWLSTQMVAQPVSADSIRYDASTVQQATLDLKTLAYSREV